MKKQSKRLLLLLTVLLNVIIICNWVSAAGMIIAHPRKHPYPRPRPRPVSPFVLDVKSHHVDVKINGRSAKTYIDQVFYNPTSRRVEGTYLFPIPEGAVIKDFSMYIDGKEYPAELLSAEKARKIYEDIVRKQLDPALLEYQGRGLFKVSIFPIQPYSERRVKISYTEILPQDNGTVEYVYPLNTGKFSVSLLKEVSINVELSSPEKIKNIYCPTHEAEVVRKGSRQAKVSYEKQNVKPDTDFKLYYHTDKSKIGMSMLTYKRPDEDGYFFLSLAPDFQISKDEIEPKDITFVLDVSGSMAGDKLRQAKKALLFCIENLNKGDRFEIIRFSTEAESLFKKLTEVTEKGLKKAREFIKKLRAMGGTNIEEALELALLMKRNSRHHSDSGIQRPTIIVFITDGKPTIGMTDENSLLGKIKRHNNSSTRIFTFGIGEQINTHLLDKITEMTKAFRSYITPEEDIEVKISNFYQKIQSPILTDLELFFGENIEIFRIYPKDLPDLFKGSSLTILGRYKGSKEASVTLKGKAKNKIRSFKFQVSFFRENEKNDFIPALWASRRIGFLLDQVRLHHREKELIDEITHLARSYGIITPYTSYLILEDEKNLVRRNIIRRSDQTLGNVIPQSSPLLEKNEEAFNSMKKRSGAGSVRSSKELQSMFQADNIEVARPGKKRLQYKDKDNKMQNVVNQVRNVQGRAFYNSGSFWVDSKIQSWKYGKAERIQFAGKEYFDFMKKNPDTAGFLALGRNVRFVWNERVYEIVE